MTIFIERIKIIKEK